MIKTNIYFLPAIVSLSILFSAGIIFFCTNVGSGNPPVIVREKPRIEVLQTKFSAFFNEEGISDEDSSIKLLGIASGKIKMALINYAGEVKTVKVGSQIGPYTVKDIQKNFIIIEKDGEKKFISFKLESSESSSGKTTSPTAEFSTTEIKRLTQDPGVLLQQIRLKPVVENEKTKGFAFEWIKPGSIFEKVGIRQGDILLAINNVEIKSAEDAFNILQTVRNEPSLNVKLLRNGQVVDINVRLE